MAQNSGSDNNANKPRPQLSEESIRSMIETQKEEVKLRQQELSLREQDQKYQYELAKESLKQQAAYLAQAPKHMHKNRIIIASFFIIILLIVSGVFIYCIHMNKEEIAMRILELIATAIISAGGGYAWGKHRAKSNEKPSVEMVD